MKHRLPVNTRDDRCTRCRKEPRREGQRWCRKCHNAYRRDTRPKYWELSARDKKRSNCRAYTNVLIKRGKLTRGPCEDCGTTKQVEAHHLDYDKPREVRWRCRPCRVAHRQKQLADEAGTTAFYERWR